MAEGIEPEQAIDRLLRRYADIATRQAWDEYAEIVLADAGITFSFGGDEDRDVEVTGPGGLAELGRAAMGAFDFYLYVPLNHVIDRLGDSDATGRAYALESMVDHDGNWFDVYGHYDDAYRLVDGTWMIARRRYRALRHQPR